MFVRYFFIFIIYAFLGYLCEVVYVSIGNRKLTNRGYLYGPICPIYGYGAVILLLALNPIYELHLWYLVFILGVVLTSTLEYLTSYFMELIFHMRWWDYSDYKFNIKGRVCLKNSLLFGILTMVVFYGLQPTVNFILNQIYTYPVAWYILFGVVLFMYVVDTILSTWKNIKVSKIFIKMEDYMDSRLEEVKDMFKKSKMYQGILRMSVHYPGMKIRYKKKKMRLPLKELLAKIGNGKE